MPISMQLLADPYTVHRLAPDAALPALPGGEPWWAVVRSRAELSVCCRSVLAIGSDRAESGWRVLRVDGPLDFTLTGIAAAITAPLAAAQVPVFVVSSYDTDYLLVKQADLGQALTALRNAAVTVEEEEEEEKK